MKHWTDSTDNWLLDVNELAKTDSWQEQVYGLMHRKGELELVLTIAEENNFDIFLELGSGSGTLLKEMQKRCPELKLIGFESRKGDPIPGIDLRRDKDIFAEDVQKEIQKIILDAKGPVLSYNDNGNKIRELKIVSEVMRPGDIIGCHDFGTEVAQIRVDFLKDLGFEIIEKYEPWIQDHLCLQRFWRKVH